MKNIAITLGLICLLAACGQAPPEPATGRLIVLGFDGMDPALTEAWMDAGLLPEFDRLRRDGHYQPLATTNPPQSPVAWASFATGTSAGDHGIFDFLRRDPDTYLPDFSVARYTPPSRHLSLGSWRLPIGEGQLDNQRQGEPLLEHGRASRTTQLGAQSTGHLPTRLDSSNAIGHGRARSARQSGDLHPLPAAAVCHRPKAVAAWFICDSVSTVGRRRLWKGPAHPLKTERPAVVAADEYPLRSRLGPRSSWMAKPDS